MIKSIPNGVYPTMITPFTADNKVDYKAVEQLIEWYTGKVDGIFSVCQSSEMFFLSFEERLELMKFVKANAPSDISVVASGHIADDLNTQIEEAKAFIDTGIDAYVFISNRFAKQEENDDIFVENIVHAVDSLPEIPFGIYECPYPYKRLITPDTLGKLAKTGKFAFLKDTCCDAGVIKQKIDAVSGTPLKIFNANSSSLLQTMKDGAAGFSGVMANFHPEIYRWLCKNFEKEPEKAQTVQDFLGAASMTERQIYPVNAKYYLSLEGLDMTVVTRTRAYDMTLSEQLEIQELRGLTKLFKDTMKIK